MEHYFARELEHFDFFHTYRDGTNSCKTTTMSHQTQEQTRTILNLTAQIPIELILTIRGYYLKQT